jgi:phage tail-like protein
MSLDKKHIKSSYPLPVYNYRVTIHGLGESLVVGFSEISGLNVEYEPVYYKHGLSFALGTQIITGMRQPIRFTLKKGIVKGGDYLYRWIHGAYLNLLPTSQRDILIDLCDENGHCVIRWTVKGAVPIKLDVPTFDANTNEVAIESLELTAQDVQIDYNPR